MSGSSIIVTLWIHESQSSSGPKPEVIFNSDLFHGAAAQGDLVELRPWKSHSASHEALTKLKAGYDNASSTFSSDGDGPRKSAKEGDSSADSRHSNYLFVVPEWAPDERTRQSGLQLSVAQHVATKFKLQPRSNVKLTLVSHLSKVTRPAT
ncbi:hypothetical protein ABW21_db0201229 [Orbilia brochopaga]|nr:hypothetical protein ABW21_db0201229 [Drechslerella brochopaga]